MASSINADNGVVSGSSGLKSTADTSGVLALQSNGTTALSVGTDLNVTLTNPLPVASGGTNSTATPTAGGVGYGTGTAHAYTGAGTSGQVLTSSGSGAPTWATANTGNFGTDITATDYTLTTSSALGTAGSTITMQAVSLDGVSELMVFQGTSSIHAVVWNSSTNTFGTPALVRTVSASAVVNTVAIQKISSTAVLVCSLVANSTALETVVITISGSTVTVGTPVATTLAANSTLIAANTRLVTVGSSYVLNYFTTSDNLPKFRAITVSGTTPSVGAQLAYAGGIYFHHAYAYSSSVLLHLSIDATTLSAYPITVSGTTLTGGTQATVASDGTVLTSGVLSTGRVAIIYKNGSNAYGALVSVGGSTATITASATPTGSSAGSPVMQVFSNQAIFLAGSSNSDRINVLTDTAGTPTVGTEVAMSVNSNMVGYLSTGKVFVANSTSTSPSQYFQYGISSGNPVLEKTFQNVVSTASPTLANYSPPLSGPRQSGSGGSINLRTSAGKIANASTTLPFPFTIDGNTVAKIQQGCNPLNAYNDAISDAVAWGVPQAISSTATSITVKKVTLV